MAETGEPGEGERRDGERARIEGVLHGPELRKGDELVEHHPRAQQSADHAAVVPRHAHRPGKGPEDPAERCLQIGREPVGIAVHGAERAVHEGDEGHERDEHGDHVQHQREPLAGAAGRGVEEVHVGLRQIELHLAVGLRHFGFRLEELGHHDGARGRHDHCGEEMPGLDAERDIGHHDRAGDVRHSRGHHRHQLGARHPRQEGPDGERRLGLPHEDRRRDVEALRAARAQHPAHHEGEGPDDDLHDADVIENGEERGNEDDGRQELEGEDDAETGVLLAELAEDEGRADVGVAQDAGDQSAQPAEERLPRRNAQHEDREEHLESQAPSDDPPSDP